MMQFKSICWRILLLGLITAPVMAGTPSMDISGNVNANGITVTSTNPNAPSAMISLINYSASGGKPNYVYNYDGNVFLGGFNGRSGLCYPNFIEGLTLDTSGRVGIRANTPDQALTLNGVMHFLSCTPGTLDTTMNNGNYGAYVWANGSTLYVRDALRNVTRLGTHADPVTVDANAKSSFNDLSVILPFSFQHENDLVGKGQVIDMAKMVKYIEKKMQSEMGEQEGKLVYNYDLPQESRISIDQYNTSKLNGLVNLIENRLSQMPWIKVEFGPNGEIPQSCVCEVEEVKSVTEDTLVKERSLDLQTMRVVEHSVMKKVNKQIKTGRKVRALKSGVQFKNGELFRRPTIEDVDVKEMQALQPELPKWLVSRIAQGRMDGEKTADIIQRVKEIMSASAARKAPEVSQVR